MTSLIGMMIPNRWKNKTCSKAPTSFTLTRRQPSYENLWNMCLLSILKLSQIGCTPSISAYIHRDMWKIRVGIAILKHPFSWEWWTYQLWWLSWGMVHMTLAQHPADVHVMAQLVSLKNFQPRCQQRIRFASKGAPIVGHGKDEKVKLRWACGLYITILWV